MRVALAFSGGRDSLCLLMHLQALWRHVDVVHVDAGDAYPQARRIVERVRANLPHFTTIHTSARAWRTKHGDPDDTNWTHCCGANFWEPLQQHLKETGYRQVLRGDRADEGHIQAVMPGDVLDGVLYTFPLWTWTRAQVDRYLDERGLLAKPYRQGADALPDCLTCTAGAVCGGRTRSLWDDDARKGDPHALDTRPAPPLRGGSPQPGDRPQEGHQAR